MIILVRQTSTSQRRFRKNEAYLAAEAALIGNEFVFPSDLVLVSDWEDGRAADVVRWQGAIQRREAVACAHELVASRTAALVRVA